MFKVGDKVKFELTSNPTRNKICYPHQPRWFEMEDRGASDTWVEGEVTALSELWSNGAKGPGMWISYKVDRTYFNWPFPNKTHHSYPGNVPGFPKLLNAQICIIDKQCLCDITLLLRAGCQCGAIEPFRKRIKNYY